MTATCTYLQQLTQVSDVAHGPLVNFCFCVSFHLFIIIIIIFFLYALFIIIFPLLVRGAPVAQWVKRWPTDPADRVRSPLKVKSSQT